MAKSKVKKFNGLPSKIAKGAERRRIVKTITIEVECEDEDRGPEGECSAWGDETDAEQAKWIRHQLENGNPWAWCVIRVKATMDDAEGSDYLGGCSYFSGEDFAKPGGGYIDDMILQAVTEMLKVRGGK